MGEDNFSLGYALGQDGNKSGGGVFDGDSWIVLILFALIFGWGRGGFGGFGGGGDGGSGNCATPADVRAAVDQQTLISKLDQQTYGLADSTYALNNAITNGFHGVDNAICNLGYQTQSGFNSLGAQLASCCCDIERGQDRIANQITSCCCDMGRQIERGFCETNANIAAQARGIIDYLTNEKIDSLRAENQALRFSASQDRQNAYLTTAMTAQTNALIDRIAPYPVPAFPVCAPYNHGGYSGFGSYSNCGCGCNCA